MNISSTLPGPIINAAANNDVRSQALAGRQEAAEPKSLAASDRADSFVAGSLREVDAQRSAQRSAQLRRLAAQQQAPVSLATTSRTSFGPNGAFSASAEQTVPKLTPDTLAPTGGAASDPLSPQALPTPLAPTEPAAPDGPNKKAFTQADLTRLLGSFGLTADQKKFDSSLDLNSDGVINGQDLAELLARMAPQTPPQPTPDQLSPTPQSPDQLTPLAPTLTQPTPDQPGPTESELPQRLQGMLKSFGLRVKGDSSASVYDLNGDGVINGADLAQLLAHFQNAPATDLNPQPSGVTSLKSILAAFGASAGQTGFTRSLDLTGDGTINGADLAQFLASLQPSS